MNVIKLFVVGLLTLVFVNISAQDKVTLLKEKLESASSEDKPHILNSLAKASLRKNRNKNVLFIVVKI